MADPVNNAVSDNWVDEAAAPAVRVEPMTLEERFIAQTLFDTQPKRRQAYLKQIGFEMDPKDTNLIRPIGSTEPYSKIDPGVIESFSGKTIAEKFKNLAKETGRDALDIVGDLVSQIIQAGTTKGAQAAAKGVAGEAGPVGQVVAQVVGGIAGGVMGTYAAEATKEHIGNIILDENIPSDKKLMAIQAAIGGVAPVMFQAGAKGLQKLYAATLQKSVEGIKNAVKATAGNVSDELLTTAAKNPEAWTPEATKGATEKLTAKFKDFFGVEPGKTITNKSTRQFNRDSVVGKLMAPLNQAADQEIEKLSANEAANFSVGELVDGIDAKIKQVSAKFDLTDNDKAALKYLNDKKKFLLGKAKNILDRRAALNPPVDKQVEGAAVKQVTEDQLKNVQITFKDARDMLKVMQDDFFQQEKLGKSSIAPFARDLRMIADQKAAAIGSPLPQINAQRSAALELANRAQEALKPQKVLAAYGPGGETVGKLSTRQIMTDIDQLAGTDYASQFENLVGQSLFENAYKVTKPMGSGRVNAAALSEGAKQALKYGGLGGGLGAVGGPQVAAVTGGLGAVGGFIKGASEGAAMANPEVALRKLSQKSLAAEAAQNAAESAMGSAGALVPQTITSVVKNIGTSTEIPEPVYQSTVDDEDWTK